MYILQYRNHIPIDELLRETDYKLQMCSYFKSPLYLQKNVSMGAELVAESQRAEVGHIFESFDISDSKCAHPLKNILSLQLMHAVARCGRLKYGCT